MPPRRTADRPQLSVLDRLLDDDPSSSQEAPLTRAESVRAYREAVRRDLEWLLNTRCPLQHAIQDCEGTIVDFGLPEFTSLTATSTQTRAHLRSALQNAVSEFEPRLTDVNVTIQEPAGRRDPQMLHFLITGMLQMEPAPEAVSFDTQWELARGTCRVSGV